MESFALLLEIACLVLAIAFVAQQVMALVSVYSESECNHGRRLAGADRTLMTAFAYKKINL